MKRPPLPPLTAAQQALAADNVKLVYWVMQRQGHRITKLAAYGLSADDCESELMHTLVRCAAQFNPARGYAFSTYAVASMTHTLSHLSCRRSPSAVAMTGWEWADYETPGLSPDDKRATAETAAAVRDAVEACPNLSHEERFILRRRFGDGVPLRTVGGELGRSGETVRLIQTRAVEKLRDFITHSRKELVPC